jgi:hypothetical protein
MCFRFAARLRLGRNEFRTKKLIVKRDMKFPALIASLLSDSHRPQDSSKPLSKHPVLTRASFVLATLVAAWAFTGSLQASTVFTMNMGGTVANGTLDGNSLNGQSFQIEAIFLDQPDLEPTSSSNGTFLSEIAYIEFGNGDVFIFDDGDFALNLQYYGEDSQFATWAIYDFPTNQYANFLGFADTDLSDAGTTLDGFDPNVLSEFEYSAFDFQLAEGSLTNQLGQTLAISELGEPSTGSYSMVATAVPEPSSMAVMFALLPACAMYRLRFSRR